MGLTMSDALVHLLHRADTPSMRSFVCSVIPCAGRWHPASKPGWCSLRELRPGEAPHHARAQVDGRPLRSPRRGGLSGSLLWCLSGWTQPVCTDSLRTRRGSNAADQLLLRDRQCATRRHVTGWVERPTLGHRNDREKLGAVRPLRWGVRAGAALTTYRRVAASGPGGQARQKGVERSNQWLKPLNP